MAGAARRPVHQHGFTLVELMVVVAIISLLAAFLFSVSDRPYGGNAKNTTEQVATFLNMTRLRAVSTRKIQQITITPRMIYLEQSTQSGFVTPTAWEMVEALKLPNRVTINSAVSPVDTATVAQVADTGLNFQIQYRPDGSTNAGFTMWLADSSTTQSRVHVYPMTGGVRVR